jgi:prepilin-type N-terminal cleavage/methylation domain-containing protein
MKQKPIETKKNMRVPSQEHGFTIIEVLISLFILGASLIIFQSSITTLSVNKFIKNQDLALRIANSEIETLKLAGYDNLPSSGTFTHPLLSTLPSGQGTITISDYNASTKEIVVNVSWFSTKTNTLTLRTLITHYGL